MMMRIGLLVILLGTLAVTAGVRYALTALVGLAIGFTLERFGFGFAGPWRRLIRERQGQGVLAQCVAIGLTAIIIQPLIASSPSLLGAIAPISVTMILGALIFGFAMQLILGCGSGTLVNAGSGNLIALVALPAFCVGSFVGTLILPLAIASTTHVTISLPETLGVTPSIIVTVLGLIGFAAWATRGQGATRWNKRLLIAAVCVAMLASLHVVIAGQPWGVVYGLGLWAAKFAAGLGWDPSTADFWMHPINAQALSQSVLTDTTSLTDFGLIAGAAFAAWKGADQTALRPSVQWWFYGAILAAGLALGISSRIAFGCNVGALFSGIASGSLHGWVWLIAAFVGSIGGVGAREWLWQRATTQETQ